MDTRHHKKRNEPGQVRAVKNPAASWARDALAVDSDMVFSALEQGLTVALIATPSEDLVTCDGDTLAVEVADRPDLAAFDFVPVRRTGEIVGLFDRDRARAELLQESSASTLCALDYMEPLSERNLISADAGILAFVASADKQPCRLLVKGTQIAGIVTTADLQKLPVRPVMFLLVTHLELMMAEVIRRKFGATDAWLSSLGQRAEGVEKRYTSLRDQKSEPLDKLVATEFCDKREIILRDGLVELPCGKNKARDQLKDVEDLIRNPVSHAGEYAPTSEKAAALAKTVRLAQDWIAIMEQALKQKPAA